MNYKVPLNGNIEISHITKRFGNVTALENVSLSIKAGTILGIVGPNGAGKSTLVRIIAGVMSSTKGKINIAGFDSNKDRKKIKSITGILPESAGLYEKLTVNEFIQLIGGLYDLNRENIEKKLQYYIRLLRLDKLENRLIETLSKGQKQKVAFIAAIINDPVVLLLDEPTIALDPKAQRILAKIILEYQREDRTIIITSHLLESLEKYCTDFAVLQEGRFTFSGTAKEFKTSVGVEDIEDAYILHVEKKEKQTKDEE